MKRQKSLWNYYSQSDFGSDVDFFTFKGRDFIEKCIDIQQVLLEDAPEEMSNLQEMVFAYQDIQASLDEIDIPAIHSEEDFYAFIEGLKIYFAEENPKTGIIRKTDTYAMDPSDIRAKCSYIPLLSVYLYSRCGWYVPLFYTERYDLFEKYCEALEIDLPDRPAENDYPQAIKYYYNVCEVINKHRSEAGLTPEEMMAVVYGYATLVTEKESEMQETLPEPRRVWITCAGIPGKKEQADFATVDSSPNKEEYWSCNRLTNPGDIVIMYCVSPRSYIHSIWRAMDLPHISPFGYRKVRVAIGNKVEIPHISLKELREDNYMSECYVVRKNFMGTHGDELSPADYDNILRMIEERGGDTSGLPRFSRPEELSGVEITCEQDVSDKILEPFLNRLGYKQGDYTPELELQLGRETKAGRPDFTVFSLRDSSYKHQYKAPFVIEVKEDFNEDGIENVKGQGLSYARYLHSHYLGLADKYSFMLFEKNSNGTFDLDEPLFYEQWRSIYTDSDVYGRILNIIHPELIKGLV